MNKQIKKMWDDLINKQVEKQMDIMYDIYVRSNIMAKKKKAIKK